MESTDFEMGEIFDDRDDEEDIGATGMMPDLGEDGATQDNTQDNDEAENAEVMARLKDLSKGAAKKVVRRPQPKLDPTRLTGERGIPILPKLFENTKFKGRGHEASDLALIMRQMEHWGHRLFPKMPFDEVIERVEKLGAKKPVQTCVKRIRMDMPILDEDFVGSDREDGQDEMDRDRDQVEDVWDEMLREEELLNVPTPGPSTQRTPGKVTRDIDDGPEFTASRIDGIPATPADKPSVSEGFTPEQLARIEKNKQLALERRLKKMGKFTPGKVPSSPFASNSASEPSTADNTSVSSEANRQDTHIVENTEARGGTSTSDISDNSSRSILNLRLDSQSQSEDLTNNSVDHDQAGKGESGNEVLTSSNEMSEVIEKGTSENVKLAGPSQQNAQKVTQESATELSASGLEAADKGSQKDMNGAKDNAQMVASNGESEKVKPETSKEKAAVETIDKNPSGVNENDLDKTDTKRKDSVENVEPVSSGNGAVESLCLGDTEDIPDEMFDSDNEMSEVLLKESSENRVLKMKEKAMDTVEVGETAKILKDKTVKQIENQEDEGLVKVSSRNNTKEDQNLCSVSDKENIDINSANVTESVDINRTSSKENVNTKGGVVERGMDGIDRTVDHTRTENTDSNVELNEQELMDTLEC